MTKDIVQIPVSQLEGIIQTDLQYLADILEQDGCLVCHVQPVSSDLSKAPLSLSQAVSSLPPAYSLAVAQLQSSAPECLELHQYPQFTLPDGSLRQSLARDSQHQSGPVPGCVAAEFDVISKLFDMAGLDFILIYKEGGWG